MTSNIVCLFYTAAGKYPDHLAIIEGEERVTYAQLRAQVRSTAKWLVKKGVRPGDRILVFVPMSIRLYRIVLAIFQIGATAVFIDEWVSRSRLELCCQIADCRAFIGVFKARVFAWFSKELRRIPIWLGTDLPKDDPGSDPGIIQVKLDDVALITFTTGNTGIPKAAKRTHGFLRAQFDALLEKMDPHANDVVVTILPIVLLINLGVGATSVIVPYKAKKAAGMDTSLIWKVIRHHNVNRLAASPFFVTQLAISGLQRPVDARGIKRIFTGGAPVFPDEAERLTGAFPSAETEIFYGSTEAEPISSISAAKLIEAGDPADGLAVGEVYRGADVRIIPYRDMPIVCEYKEAFDQLVLPPGQVGEIVVSGPHVLTEYVNNDEALRRNKIFVDGVCWHRTGDSGYLNTEGLLYLTGRCNTIINHQGRNISPFVYEYRLRRIPGIACGTLLQRGSQLVAVLEKIPGFSQADIEKALMTLDLPTITIQWVKKIPRDPRHHSKIDYEALRDASTKR